MNLDTRTYLMATGVGILCILAGCGKEASTPPLSPQAQKAAAESGPVDGDWLMGRMPNEPGKINPITSTDAYARALEDLIFDSLLDYENETLAKEPRLAESWEIAPDHLTYTFNLRKGVVFSDGAPLTAHDVKFTFDRLMEPTTDSAHLRNYYQDIELCEVVDNHTVRFTCKKPYFKHLTMLGGISVMPRHIYGEGDINVHPNDRNPVGSGPYVLEGWETGLRMTLARNERYWGEKRHILKRVYKIITEPNAAFQVLERQELDQMGLTPELYMNRANKPAFQAKFDVHTYYAAGYSYVGWNMRRPLFQDKMVRRALTMLLCRQEILETIYYGLGKLVTGSFFVDGPEYDSSVEPWPFDPQQARQLLEAAGWRDSDRDGLRDKDGAPFRFELLIVANKPETEAMATVYQEELKRAGIEMIIRRLEFNTLIERLDTFNFDSAVMGWSIPRIEADGYQVWHSSQAVEKGSNFVGFKNAEADQILEQVRLEFDEQKRFALNHRFHAILHEEQPYSFMFCLESLQAVDKRFQNVRIYPGGLDALEWWVPASLQRYP